MQALRLSALLSVFASFTCLAGNESILELVYAPPVQAARPPILQAGQNQPAPQAANSPVDCKLVLMPPIDARNNKETLGTTFRDNPMVSNRPVTEWLTEVLMSLKQQGFSQIEQATARPANNASNTVIISPSIEKLYVWNHSMNLHSTLVVKAAFSKENRPEEKKNYRLIGSKLNWANGDSEFVDTINEAATRLAEQIADDAKKLCQNQN